MSKPILVVRVPIDTSNNNIDELRKVLSIHLTDYHLILFKDNVKKITFECYNDCKGLKDIDIENLIKKIKL
jgi:hypothetical protein